MCELENVFSSVHSLDECRRHVDADGGDLVGRALMDITYIPMARGFIYLAAVMDWFTRRILAWRVSITLEADFCIEAIREALARHGTPDLFNTDQGSQFTSTEFIKVLADREIKISMDGKGAWRDNVFVERLWRTIKHEEVFTATCGKPGPPLGAI